ncbi:helicase-related protein [Motilimonas eburnea]|uniref:helicase-related protein n=1 Tax=Motilimonas eburnea TaxID=1737488 RepID=UPI001E584FE3|nr:helicase-related protein [Motilimonas eburnea]MCE2571723.1 N-6 DNA methylase [Motilimonas eburnea]
MNLQTTGHFLDFLLEQPMNTVAIAVESTLGHQDPILNNIECIKVINALKESGKRPTSDELKLLKSFQCWGKFAQAFEADHKHNDALRIHLTSEQYEAAATSLNTAFYTPDSLKDALYRTILRLGFDENGLLLDPSTGTGIFLNVPSQLRNCKKFAIELDPSTGQLARFCHPEAEVYVNQRFEHVDLPHSGQFSLAVSNVPFGKLPAQDNKRYKEKMSIHNYFIRRMIDEIHCGGLVAVIVSAWFLDSKNDIARRAIASQAKLTCAVRLPSEVFNESGADVVTDILIFQKVGAEFGDVNAPWVSTADTQDSAGNPLTINQIYLDHPEYIIGSLSAPSSFHASCSVVSQPDFANALQAALDNQSLNPVFHRPRLDYSQTDNGFTFDAAELAYPAQPFEFTQLNTGELVQRLEDKINQDGANVAYFRYVDTNNAVHCQRIRASLPIKQALKNLLKFETSTSHSKTVIDQARAELNVYYQSFVSKFGCFHSVGVERALSSDPYYYRLKALEINYDKGISKAQARKLGIPEVKPSWEPAKILSERVFKPYQAPTTANNPVEALYISLQELDCIDINYIAKLTKRTVDDCLDALRGLIFKDPNDPSQWLLGASYLSGNLRQKITDAETAAHNDPSFKDNIQALRAALPAPLSAADITVQLHSSWVPCQYFTDFICSLVGERSRVKVVYAAGRFYVEGYASSHVANTQTYGTKRKSCLELLNLIMNNSEVVVKDPHPTEDKYIVNEVETTNALDAANTIKEEFNQWIFKDETRRADLVAIYNDTFNVWAKPCFDGAHLTLRHCTMTPYEHQKTLIWRSLFSNNLLIDACVGAGKTLTQIASIMEHRRLKGYRAMVVMPNHLVSQFSEAALSLYPTANVLTLDPSLMSTKYRAETLARISITDFDMCIIPLSSFTMLPMPTDTEREVLEQEIDTILTGIQLLDDANISVKRLMKKKETLEAKLQELTDRHIESTITWDDLNIDMLLVDEAHYIKNVPFACGLSGVCGIGNPNGSKRAYNALIKVRNIQNKGGKVIFSTGTVLSNSVSEVYNYIKYLCPQELERLNLGYFDVFSSLFAIPESQYEVAPSGKGYKIRTRLRRFCNLPELSNLYSSFAETITKDELGNALPRLTDGRPAIPPMKNGQKTIVTLDACEAQTDIFNQIVEDAKDLGPGKNNMLELMTRGRLAAVDPRIIDPFANTTSNRLHAVVSNVVSKYHEFNNVLGTQILFCDTSVPARAKAGANKTLLKLFADAENGNQKAQAELDKLDPALVASIAKSSFSFYDEVTSLLAEHIPAEQIAVIHDYSTDTKRQELSRMLNAGKIRVLLASTALAGSGLNVNQKLCALHHLDVPYRPSDFEQRSGRMDRVGNLLWQASPDFYIEEFIYCTRGTLDSFMYGLLETKATMIKQFQTGDLNTREISECDNEMTFAEIKAAVSDNPLILEHVKGVSRIKQLKILERRYQQREFEYQDTIAYLTKLNKRLTKLIPLVNADAANHSANKHSEGDTFSIEIDSSHYDFKGTVYNPFSRSAPTPNEQGAVNALAVAAKSFSRFAKIGDDKIIGSYHGFDIAIIIPSSAQRWRNLSSLDVIVELRGKASYEVKPNKMNYRSIVNEFDRILNSLTSLGFTYAATIERNNLDIENAKSQLGKPFAHKDELATLSQRVHDIEILLAEQTAQAA